MISLAVMIGIDQDAFICDMAETYHILDIWALPAETLAVLASGLRDNSRIKMKLSGMRHIPVEIILPQVADMLTMVFSDKDAQPPVLFTDIMLGNVDTKETKGFDSGEEFDNEWKRITGGLNG